MSSMDTKWKKNIPITSNVEGLTNKLENKSITRSEKDKEQTKMLDELKFRIKNIHNKRKGFTRLPHLTDVNDDRDGLENDDKDGFENDDKDGLENDDKDGFDNDDRDGFDNDDDIDGFKTKKKKSFKNNFKKKNIMTGKPKTLNRPKAVNIPNAPNRPKAFNAPNAPNAPNIPKAPKEPNNLWNYLLNFCSGQWGKLNPYPHGASLGLTYILFLFIYLQLYHLNFKKDFQSNGQDGQNETDKLPSELKDILENIADSLSKTLGSWVKDPEYVDIKHNEFLKIVNYFARFDAGVFFRYIFIPVQVVVAITHNIIPNMKIIPILGNKYFFTVLFVVLFMMSYGKFVIKEIDSLPRAKRKGTNTDGKWWGFITKYYSHIPISYFVIVGIIIICAFALDFLKQMGDGSYFGDGLFAAIAKTLFKIFSLSMSIVLSGLAAIPLGIYALTWFIFPEGIGVPNTSKWSNAIRDNYLVPEWDVCEESMIKKWIYYLFRKLWNNKILISTFVIIDIMITLSIGKGDWVDGEEIRNEMWNWYFFRFIFPLLFIVSIFSQQTTKEKPLLDYLKPSSTIQKIKSIIQYLRGNSVTTDEQPPTNV